MENFRLNIYRQNGSLILSIRLPDHSKAEALDFYMNYVIQGYKRLELLVERKGKMEIIKKNY